MVAVSEPAKRTGRRPGNSGYTVRVRQILADLVSYGEAFGLRELRLHDSYLYTMDAEMKGEDLPEDRVVARVLWRLAKDGELQQVNSGRGQGKRALYVRGRNWREE
jgi:hypothetical protein